ncbi:MAG: 6,7-dimethyl-8-ribityllumazine synthase [Elusimicrobia bacterium]|nr:6,7-dimethyl-8-ribityllumazine synthase [Elusimicrobiota bacterium]
MKIIEAKLSAKGMKFAIVCARFNSFLSDKLTEGALDCLKRHEAGEEDITLVKVPGSYELPFIARKTAMSKKYDAIIALGVIIKGDTPHFDFVAAETAKGLAQASMETGVPVSFGVVTAENLEQAIERCGTKQGNKGFDAAMTALEMASLNKIIK